RRLPRLPSLARAGRGTLRAAEIRPNSSLAPSQGRVGVGALPPGSAEQPGESQDGRLLLQPAAPICQPWPGYLRQPPPTWRDLLLDDVWLAEFLRRRRGPGRRFPAPGSDAPRPRGDHRPGPDRLRPAARDRAPLGRDLPPSLAGEGRGGGCSSAQSLEPHRVADDPYQDAAAHDGGEEFLELTLVGCQGEDEPDHAAVHAPEDNLFGPRPESLAPAAR